MQVAAVVGLLWVLATVASAQEAPEGPAPAGAAEAEAASEAEMAAADTVAREHFRIGKTLYEAGRFEQAGEEFHEAYRLSGRSQLLYNVYVAYRDANDFPKAIEALRQYLEEVEEAPDQITLRARLKAMEVAEAERQAHRAAAEAAGRADAEAAAQPDTRTEIERSWVPDVLMYGGAALVLASVGTGIATLSTRNDLDKACNDDKLCPPEEGGKVDKGQALALTTDVLLFSGLAVAATGLVLRLTGALDKEREVPVAFGCGPSGCGALVRGRF